MTSDTFTASDLATPGFGVDNLPYGSYEVDGKTRLGVRLGDSVVDLAELAANVGGLDDDVVDAVGHHNLDVLLAGGRTLWAPLRQWVKEVVSSPQHSESVRKAVTPISNVTMKLAFTPADYVDFYASEHHATNLGKMFRPDEAALKPNWKHIPVGYHGRSGTIVVSGTDVTRPKGLRPEDSGTPSFGPSRRLDIEAEMGFVLGGSAPEGEVSVHDAAADHIFGLFLFNDWSARDIQNFEYVPLGPNLGKSFASSISDWIVPFDAFNHARVAPPERTYELAEYLKDGTDDFGPFGLDITLEVEVDGQIVSHPPFALMYYTAPQMVAHMAVNGASIRPGDLFASGTISGPAPDQRGSFIELSWGGKEPLRLAAGTEMTFLQDGQTVVIRGSAPGPAGATISLGECRGTIVPATS